MITNDYSMNGLYRARYLKVDGVIKIWIVGISSPIIENGEMIEITPSNKDKYKKILLTPLWLSSSIKTEVEKTSENDSGWCWVAFEGSNLNNPVIVGLHSVNAELRS